MDSTKNDSIITNLTPSNRLIYTTLNLSIPNHQGDEITIFCMRFNGT